MDLWPALDPPFLTWLLLRLLRGETFLRNRGSAADIIIFSLCTPRCMPCTAVIDAVELLATTWGCYRSALTDVMPPFDASTWFWRDPSCVVGVVSVLVHTGVLTCDGRKIAAPDVLSLLMQSVGLCGVCVLHSSELVTPTLESLSMVGETGVLATAD